MENSNYIYFDQNTQELLEKDVTIYAEWLKEKMIRHLPAKQIIVLALSEFESEIPASTTETVLPISNLWFYLSEMKDISNDIKSELTDLMLFCEDQFISSTHTLSRKEFVNEVIRLIRLEN